MNAPTEKRFLRIAGEGKLRYWTTPEVKVLREHYPLGGAVACLPLLPYRTLGMVYAKASALGIKAPYVPRSGFKRRTWTTDEHMDAAIRRVYQLPPRKNAINELAAALQRPRWWVSNRAADLGMVQPRFKEPEWTEAEIELLGDNSHKDVAAIQKLFLRHGYKRTRTALSVKRTRLHFSTQDPGYCTATALARLLGVDAKTVTRWIEKEGLPATRRGTARLEIQGGDHWSIALKQFRAWISAHRQLVNLRKVDQPWFYEEVVFATSGGRKG